MSIQITPSNQIKTHFTNSYVQTHPVPLVLNKWTFVSATFYYIIFKTNNIAEIFSNTIVGTNSLSFDIEKVDASNLPDSSPPEIFRIGGSSSFIGEISLINFYTPAGVVPPRKDNFP